MNLGQCSRDVCCPGETTNNGMDECDIDRSNIVFVSSSSSSGNLGGLAGADAECQRLAEDANLAGTYRAWLSAPGAAAPIHAPTRIPGGGPFVLVNGDLVATNVSDFIDRDGPDIALNVTQWNAARSTSVWTGTTAGGTYGGLACSVWNTTTATGIVGTTTSHAADWTDTGAAATCSTSAALYCFQDGCFADTMNDENNCGACNNRCGTAETCIQGRCGAYAFLTSQPHNGDFDGLAGGDAFCNSLAAAAGRPGTYVAWLSTTAAAAASRIVDTEYYRFDNRRIAANRDSLFRSNLENPINVRETGMLAPEPSPVWTGTSASGSATGFTCSGWGTTDANGSYGNSHAVDITWTFVDAPNGVICTPALPIYCFQTGR